MEGQAIFIDSEHGNRIEQRTNIYQVSRSSEPPVYGLGIPIVYMSGASGHEWTSHGVPNSVLIAKPFAIGQIVTAVSQLLNAGGPAVSE